jgi:pimeloyl-ACP methyl ester carboxylesterase
MTTKILRIFKWIGLAISVILFTILFILVIFRIKAYFREISDHVDVAPTTGRFIKSEDLEVFIQEAGPKSGPAVLLIGGTGAWSEIWRNTMNSLADAGFHAIAIDMPPFGYSKKPDGLSYSRQEQAKRIIGVLDALNISHVTLVGHSVGAGPTVEAVLMASNKVKNLVLVDAALALSSDGSESEGLVSKTVSGLFGTRITRNIIISSTLTNPVFSKSFLKLFIFDPADATDEIVQVYQKPFVVKGNTDKFGDWALNFFQPDTISLSKKIESYKNIKMPVLVVWGREDTITPLSQGEQIAELIPGSELVIMEKIGHIPQIEDVEAFNEILLNFLTKHNFGL